MPKTLGYDRDVAINAYEAAARIVPAVRSEHGSRIEIGVFAGRSLMRSERVVANLSALGVWDYGFCLKCRQGFGASRIQLMSASGSTSTFVWILRIRKSEWLRGSVERQPVSRDSVLWCKWRVRHDSNVWPSPSEGNSNRLSDRGKSNLRWLHVRATKAELLGVLFSG